MRESRGARGLFIWTDCDREGEHIGSEVERAARKGNAQIQVKRAKFNNLERACASYDWLGELTVDILFMRLNIPLRWTIDKLPR